MWNPGIRTILAGSGRSLQPKLPRILSSSFSVGPISSDSDDISNSRSRGSGYGTPEKVLRAKERGDGISEILNRVKERDGLEAAPPNIQYLIGRASRAGAGTGKGSDTLDIADKTQLILQSSHPVRYIVER
jgi:hypothetical protein